MQFGSEGEKNVFSDKNEKKGDFAHSQKRVHMCQKKTVIRTGISFPLRTREVIWPVAVCTGSPDDGLTATDE